MNDDSSLLVLRDIAEKLTVLVETVTLLQRDTDQIKQNQKKNLGGCRLSLKDGYYKDVRLFGFVSVWGRVEPCAVIGKLDGIRYRLDVVPISSISIEV